MSDAYYHRGLTIEFDLSVPKVTIEGRELQVENLSGIFALSDSASVKAEKLRRYGEQLIEQSPGFQEREAAVKDNLAILKKGVTEWNRWRTENPTIRPLLYNAVLTKHALRFGLDGADFANAVLINADLRGQSLRGANFHEANLGRAKLHKADLTRANFCRTDLYETQMKDAILNDANLQGTQLAKTNFEGAKLIGCKVYGISAWDLRLDGAEQRDLVIRYRQGTRGENVEENSEAQITVDDLQVAQFIYLLLNNENITRAIDTIGEKGVLILGRFTKDRKHVLDQIRKRLREFDYGFVPMVFDFDRPTQRDFTETIKILAGMSRFIIADITNPKSSPLELQAIIPDYMIPLVPILQEGEYPFTMFRDLQQKYDKWVLDVLTYDSVDTLLQVLDQAVVRPALERADQLLVQKTEAIRVRRASDYK